MYAILLACSSGTSEAKLFTSNLPDSRISKLTISGNELRWFDHTSFIRSENEIIRFFRSLLPESEQNLDQVLRKSFSNPQMWRIWMQLRDSLREKIILQLLPVLLGSNDESLHCSDAYRLCLADNNCRMKYWHFRSSCLNENMSLEEWFAASEFELSVMRQKARFRRKTPKQFRKFNRLRRNRKTRRRRTRKLKHNRYRSPSTISPKKFRRVMKEATAELHYWMGRYWPNIYAKPFSIEPQCTPECLNSLIMLNKTVYGGLLAKCDCKAKRDKNNQSQTEWDEAMCSEQQAKAIQCRPRLFKPRKAVIGCTESRLKCENDPRCQKEQENFLQKCSQVISGVTCSDGCIEARDRLAIASRHFRTCVCDGTEMRACRIIRENLETLCASNSIDFVKNRASISTISVKRTKRSSLVYANGTFTASCNMYFSMLVFVVNVLYHHLFFT